MIESIAHKGLRLLWEKNDPSKLPPEQIEKNKAHSFSNKYGQNIRTIKNGAGV